MTDTERKVMDVWKEVFQRDDFSITDNFFEIGGDSIKAMRIYMVLTESVADINIEDFFDCQTVQAIAAAIDEKQLWKEN